MKVLKIVLGVVAVGIASYFGIKAIDKISNNKKNEEDECGDEDCCYSEEED